VLPMRILFLVRALGRADAERQLVNPAIGLHRRGHVVRVVTFYPGAPWKRTWSPRVCRSTGGKRMYTRNRREAKKLIPVGLDSTLPPYYVSRVTEDRREYFRKD
jgi:hypothetical protein